MATSQSTTGAVVQVISLSQEDSSDYSEANILPAHQPTVEVSVARDWSAKSTNPCQAKKRNHQKGYGNLFAPRATLRWKKSRAHQRATLMYQNQKSYRHKDPAGRIYNGIEEDRYILPNDLHLARMMVQCTDEVYTGAANSTWRRTFIRNVGPMTIRVAEWPFRSLPIDRALWTDREWKTICWRWPLACFAMSFAVGSPMRFNHACLLTTSSSYTQVPFAEIVLRQTTTHLSHISTGVIPRSREIPWRIQSEKGNQHLHKLIPSQTVPYTRESSGSERTVSTILYCLTSPT